MSVLGMAEVVILLLTLMYQLWRKCLCPHRIILEMNDQTDEDNNTQTHFAQNELKEFHRTSKASKLDTHQIYRLLILCHDLQILQISSLELKIYNQRIELCRTKYYKLKIKFQKQGITYLISNLIPHFINQTSRCIFQCNKSFIISICILSS